MNRTSASAIALATLLLTAPGPAFAKSKAARLHVDVLDGVSGDTVKIDVPLSVARATLAISGSLNLAVDDSDGSLEKLRATWKEIRKNGSSTITTENKEETVKITAAADLVKIEVRDTATKARKVLVNLPGDAVDALFAAEGSLDLGGALEKLRDKVDGDLIRVDDGTDHVRIWIDN